MADTVDFQFDLFSSAAAPGSVLSSGRRSSVAGLGTVECSTLSGVVGYCVDWVQPPAHADFHDYNIQLQLRSYTSAATGLLLEGLVGLEDGAETLPLLLVSAVTRWSPVGREV